MREKCDLAMPDGPGLPGWLKTEYISRMFAPRSFSRHRIKREALFKQRRSRRPDRRYAVCRGQRRVRRAPAEPDDRPLRAASVFANSQNRPVRREASTAKTDRRSSSCRCGLGRSARPVVRRRRRVARRSQDLRRTQFSPASSTRRNCPHITFSLLVPRPCATLGLAVNEAMACGTAIVSDQVATADGRPSNGQSRPADVDGVDLGAGRLFGQVRRHGRRRAKPAEASMKISRIETALAKTADLP